MDAKPWIFYIIANGPRTYAGVSPDPLRRLRQHNGELAGGAKYTTGFGPGWYHVCFVKGFATSRQALQFEWAVKHHPPRKTGGIRSRLEKLHAVLRKENWTSRAPRSSTIPLSLEWLVDPVCTLPLPPHVSVRHSLGSPPGPPPPGKVYPNDGGDAVHCSTSVPKGLLSGMVDNQVCTDTRPEEGTDHEK